MTCHRIRLFGDPRGYAVRLGSGGRILAVIHKIDYRKLFSGPLDGDGRRSIYIKVTRMEGPQFLELFDFPNPTATRGRRDQTNVPAQALALLNDPFVIDQSRFWA